MLMGAGFAKVVGGPQGVGLGVGVGVGVGVGTKHGVTHTPKLVIVSMRHPARPELVSDPMRKRRLNVCPMRFGPRFTTVVM